MTRVIGGSARGRRLAAPPGRGTRPTADRVREALFSSLEAELGTLSGLRVLDLYAGSGAVGLEARSRGAATVTLVEQDRRTAGVIRDNARSLGFDAVEVRASATSRVLAEPAAAPYDLVFSDPPYPLATTRVEADLRALHENGWLAEAALVVVERSARGEPLTWPPGYDEERTRRYGETLLWYGRATG